MKFGQMDELISASSHNTVPKQYSNRNMKMLAFLFKGLFNSRNALWGNTLQLNNMKFNFKAWNFCIDLILLIGEGGREGRKRERI